MLALHEGAANSGTLAAKMPKHRQRIFGSTSLLTRNTHDRWCLLGPPSTGLGARLNKNSDLAWNQLNCSCLCSDYIIDIYSQ